MDSRDSNGVLDEATYTKQRSYVETCGGALNTVRRASFVVFGELALSVEALCMHVYSEQTARDKIQFLLRSRRGENFPRYHDLVGPLSSVSGSRKSLSMPRDVGAPICSSPSYVETKRD